MVLQSFRARFPRKNKKPGFVPEVLAWPPLQSLAVKKKLFFVQILGGEKLLKFVENCAGEIYLGGLRGAKNVQSRFKSFFGSFFAFFKPFFVSI